MGIDYSENLVKNYTGELGITDWTGSGFQDVVGGTGGTFNKCFAISPNGYMQQTIVPDGPAVTLKIRAKAYVPMLQWIIQYGLLIVKVHYSDDTYDVFAFPFQNVYTSSRDGNVPGDSLVAFTYINEIVPLKQDQDLSIEEIVVRVQSSSFAETDIYIDEIEIFYGQDENAVKDIIETDMYDNGFRLKHPDGTYTSYTMTKDSQGRVTSITDQQTGKVVNFNWNSGNLP